MRRSWLGFGMVLVAALMVGCGGGAMMSRGSTAPPMGGSSLSMKLVFGTPAMRPREGINANAQSVEINILSQATNQPEVSPTIVDHTPGVATQTVTIANVPPGAATVSVQSFSGANGTGSVLDAGSTQVTIGAGVNQVAVTVSAVANGELYVATNLNNSILRFANGLTATGNVSPAATIAGAQTGLRNPHDLAIDPAHDRLYVTTAASVLVFDGVSTLSGNVTPTRTITSTSFSNLFGVAVDLTRDKLFVADFNNNSIFVFDNASTINGTVIPNRQITIGVTTCVHILDDPANDRLFVANRDVSTVTEYDNASSTNNPAAATRTISGGNTQFVTPEGVEIDEAGDLVVSDDTDHALLIFANAGTVNNNATPKAIITGNQTGIIDAEQLFFDPGSSTLFATDAFANDVIAYTNIGGLTGNVAPTRAIVGGNTTIGGQSIGVALDPTR